MTPVPTWSVIIWFCHTAAWWHSTHYLSPCWYIMTIMRYISSHTYNGNPCYVNHVFATDVLKNTFISMDHGGVTWNSTKNLQYSWMFPKPFQYQCIKITKMHTHLLFHTSEYFFNSLGPSDAHMRQQCVQIMACHLDDTNAGILLIWPLGTNFNKMLIKIHIFLLKKCIWKCCQRNGGHFVWASMC